MYKPPPVFSYRARWVALERLQLHRKSLNKNFSFATVKYLSIQI